MLFDIVVDLPIKFEIISSLILLELETTARNISNDIVCICSNSNARY